jgi:predicted alternative tryptophan synthase beta-subunit
MEGLAWLLVALLIGGGGSYALVSFQNSQRRLRAEKHRKMLEDEGYAVPKIEECVCPRDVRIVGETSTGKRVCLVCEKRIIE